MPYSTIELNKKIKERIDDICAKCKTNPSYILKEMSASRIKTIQDEFCDKAGIVSATKKLINEPYLFHHVKSLVKDFKKMNLLEPLQADWYKDIFNIEMHIMSKSGSIIYDGKIVELKEIKKQQKLKKVKTLDAYTNNPDGTKTYWTMKHTDAKGGGQDNQYMDILNSILYADLKKNSGFKFNALVSGSYYTPTVMATLRKEASIRGIEVINIDEHLKV